MLLRWWISLVLSAVAYDSSAQLSKDSLLQIIASNKKDAEEVRAHIFLANEFLRSNSDKAKAYTFKAIPLAKEIDKPDLLSGLYSLLITVHTNGGSPDSANHYLALLKELSVVHKAEKLSKIHFNYQASAGLS
jgi:hypothetical protein